MEPASAESTAAPGPPPNLAAVKLIERIPRLTLMIGLIAAVLAILVFGDYRFSAGLAFGTVLGWLNFRLLRRGVAAIVASAGPPGANKPRAPIVAAVFRYGLIGLSVYVIFEYLHVPLVSLALGLCAAGVATVAASIWAIRKPEEHANGGGGPL